MKSCVCFIWSYCSFNRKRFLHRSIDGDCLFCSPLLLARFQKDCSDKQSFRLLANFRKNSFGFCWSQTLVCEDLSSMVSTHVLPLRCDFAIAHGVGYCSEDCSWCAIFRVLMENFTWKVSGWFQERVELGWGLIAVPNHPPSHQCSFKNDSSCQKLHVFTPGCAIFTRVSE